VELTGALAGLTLALQNTKLIALSGMITGIAAAMSMAASEYLPTRSEQTGKHPVRAAVYTGIAYIITVVLLITPYLLFENFYLDLALALSTAIIIIAAFNYYISVAKDEPFRARFLEMAGLSFGVAAISFVVGYLIRQVLARGRNAAERSCDCPRGRPPKTSEIDDGLYNTHRSTSMNRTNPLTFAKALADETRQKIMNACCCRWLAVNEIVAQVDVSQPTVSHHLAVLREAGLVNVREDGKQTFYTLDQSGLYAAAS
jgi:DNA-binding transcriptional ArsR family regulator